MSYVFAQEIIMISTDQKLLCPIQFNYSWLFGFPNGVF